MTDLSRTQLSIQQIYPRPDQSKPLKMPTLTDMPTELLQAVAVYLPPSAKIDLSLTCKDLRQAVGLELFRCVSLGFDYENYRFPNIFGTDSDDEDSEDDDGQETRQLPIPIPRPTFTRSGHQLARMIRENDAIASRIESMIINLQPCGNCYGQRKLKYRLLRDYKDYYGLSVEEGDRTRLYCRRLFTEDTLDLLSPSPPDSWADSWTDSWSDSTPPSPMTDWMPSSPTTDSMPSSPTTDLMSMLPALKTLVVRAPLQFCPRDFPWPPNLESLTLGDSVQGQMVIHMDELAPTLYNAPLKSLVLDGVILKDEASGALNGHDGVISNITSLELRQVFIQKEGTLTALLGCLGALTSIKIDLYWEGSPSLIDVSLALQRNQQLSLREVEISYAGSFRRLNLGLLNLKGISNLKKLTVDPSMLLGLGVCPTYRSMWRVKADARERIPIYQGPDEMASRLPGSLEELELTIDLEQAARVPEYREGILESLYAALPGFPDLRRITFLEDRSFQGKAQCNPSADVKILPPQAELHDKCPKPILSNPDDVLGWPSGRFPAMNDEQALRFSEFQDKFQQNGVQLSYVGQHLLTKGPGQ